MTSAWVLIIASVLHFGLHKSCFLSLEQLPVVPDTILARHIAYCAMLHFLYDQELLPARYRRKMGRLTGFLVELVLGVAFMEVLAQWLWLRIEHIVHRVLQLTLRRYGGLTMDLYQHLEGAFMRGIMTSLAGLLWLNAYAATDPTDQLVKPKPKVVAPCPVKASFKLRRRRLARRKEQLARRIRNPNQNQNQEKVSVTEQQQQQKPDPEEEEDGPEHLTVVASTSDC